MNCSKKVERTAGWIMDKSDIQMVEKVGSCNGLPPFTIWITDALEATIQTAIWIAIDNLFAIQILYYSSHDLNSQQLKVRYSDFLLFLMPGIKDILKERTKGPQLSSYFEKSLEIQIDQVVLFYLFNIPYNFHLYFCIRCS